MPGYDGTGPFGDGRPGRGLGPCGRFGTAFIGGFGRGFVRRFGRGFCRRFWRGYSRGYRWDYPPYNGPVDFQEMYPYSRENLEAQKKELEKQLEWLNQQLENSKDN